MKQYIRYYIDSLGNSHLHTQTTPIDFEPLGVSSKGQKPIEKFDVEIETGEEFFIPARDLLPLVARENQQETPSIANVPMRQGEEKPGKGNPDRTVDPGKIRNPDS